jgi:signal transduction histidine kinase
MTASNRPDRLITLTRDHEHWVLAAMLLSLHLAIWSPPENPVAASMLLVHLGLFLLWQPVVRGDQRLDWPGAALFLVFTVTFVLFIDWWLIMAWLILLIGLVGGRASAISVKRYRNLLTLVFLVSELLIRCIPELFYVRGLPAAIVTLFQYGLLAVPAALPLMGVPRQSQRPRAPLDLFRGMTASLMSALVALGSLVHMYRTGSAYPVALLQSLLVLATFLFAISWLITPRAGGSSGLAQLWERSLLNIGTPFETWLAELARLADTQQTPPAFLQAAMVELVKLPWVQGVEWHGDDGDGRAGAVGRYPIRIDADSLRVILYTHRPAGPTLLLHGKLLVHLLGDFYVAKRREAELTRQAHMQAIHETGARVTHDIKNLLQSLQTITMALAQDRLAEPPVDRRQEGARGRQLLERQLPLINQRLRLALDKLQAPEKSVSEQLPVPEWWEQIRTRNPGEDVKFTAAIDTDRTLPADLFDSVTENLLENARNKKLTEPALRTAVHLQATDQNLVLRIADDGSPLPAAIADRLFRQPLASESGLGIGLYQAARLAESYDYTLHLLRNEPGHVCFELASRAVPAPPGAQYPLFTPT